MTKIQTWRLEPRVGWSSSVHGGRNVFPTQRTRKQNAALTIVGTVTLKGLPLETYQPGLTFREVPQLSAGDHVFNT